MVEPVTFPLIEQTPEFLDLARRAHAWIRRRTVAVLAARRGSLTLVGSGVLVRVLDRTFVATAAHVMDDVRRFGGRPALGGAPGRAEVFELGAGRWFETRKPRAGRRSDRHDVAVLPLTSRDVENLKGAYEAIPIDRFLDGYLAGSPDTLACNGFPGALSEPKKVGDVPYVQLEDTFFWTQSLPEIPARLSRACSGPLLPIPVRYSRRPDLRAGLVGRAPAPKGVSGGGLWLLRRAGSPLDAWTEDEIGLLGIVTEWPEHEPCLLATTALLAVRFIHSFEPELRPAIEELYPSFRDVPRADEVGPRSRR